MKDRKIFKLLMLCTVLTLGLCLASSWAMAAPCTDPNGHAWKYWGDGRYLLAECENCKLRVSLVLSAKDKVYDGNPANDCVSVYDAMNQWGGELGYIPKICYYKDDGTPLTSAPVDVGTYSAAITAGSGPLELTINEFFEILPKSIRIPALETTADDYDGSKHNLSRWIDNLQDNYVNVYVNDKTSDEYMDAGKYTVKFTLKDPVNTTWTNGIKDEITYQFFVNKVPLIIQATSRNATVGDNAPDFSNPQAFDHSNPQIDYDYKIQEGDDAAEQDLNNGRLQISLDASFPVSDNKLSKEGTYTISPKISGSAVKNYTFYADDGTLTVAAPNTPTVRIPTPQKTYFTYNGREVEFMATPSRYAGYKVVDGSSLWATNAGKYRVELALTDANTKWSDGTTANKVFNWEILPETLIIQVYDKNATVGGLAPDLSKPVENTDYTFTNSPRMDDLDKITVKLSYQGLDPSMNIENPGTYKIQATVEGEPIDAENYNVYVAPGKLNVVSGSAPVPAYIQIPVPNTNAFAYNGNEQTFMTIASDAGYTASAGSTLKATDAGTYNVTLQLKDKTNTTWSDGTTKDKEYTFEILKASLIVQVKNKITSVGDTAPDLKNAAEGTDYTFLKLPASGDTITVSLSYASTPDMSQAGTTAIKATVSGEDADNYEIVTADGMLVVQAAGAPGTVLIPVLTSNNFLYDGTEQTFMTVSADAGYTATTDSTLKGKNVGTYHVTLQLKDKANTTWSDGSTTDKDYTFKIWKAPLVVHVKDKSASVGATAPGLKNAVEGTDYTFLRAPMGGDKINVSLNYAATPDMSQEGTTAIRANVTGQNIENYDVIVAEGTLTVVPDDSPEPPLYAMTQGVNSEWDTGSSEDARFRSTAPYAKFQDVLVDEQLVDPSNYTVSEGSTIIDLKPKFLKMLAAGRHKITIRSNDGKVSCYFWIKNPLPGTGDTSNLPLWFALFAAATAAGILLMKKRKAN